MRLSKSFGVARHGIRLDYGRAISAAGQGWMSQQWLWRKFSAAGGFGTEPWNPASRRVRETWGTRQTSIISNLGFHNTAKGDVHYGLERASDDRYPESEAGT